MSPFIFLLIILLPLLPPLVPYCCSHHHPHSLRLHEKLVSIIGCVTLSYLFSMHFTVKLFSLIVVSFFYLAVSFSLTLVPTTINLLVFGFQASQERLVHQLNSA